MLPTYLYARTPSSAHDQVDRQIEYYTDLYMGREGDDGKRYAKDVLGPRLRKGIEAFRMRSLEFAVRFTQLDDQYPVNLVNFADGICDACIIGNHCRNDQRDIDSMYDFIGVAQWLGAIAQKDFTPIPNEHGLERVETTKALVARVVDHADYWESIRA